MSNDAGIRLHYTGEVTIESIIRYYLSLGWSLDYQGQINIVPLGDKECFNWISLKTTEQDRAFSIVQEKINAAEVVGLTLIWGGTDIGVDALFDLENSILFSISVNRKVLERTEFTDVSWYLPKLLIPLLENNIPVEYVEWSEHV